jgi:hypothetical protein
MEYYGFEDMQANHAVSKELEAVFLRAGMGPPQVLRAGGREVAFSDLAQAGDRLRLSVVRVEWARYLWWTLQDILGGASRA